MLRHTTGLATTDGAHLPSPGGQMTSAKEKATFSKCYSRKWLLHSHAKRVKAQSWSLFSAAVVGKQHSCPLNEE
ncbi:hypothetical protein D5086_026575 [Populus alba]|uniref:Uncharacterized protein n=1 Tax=Populus alba TaxID=43335 RepID=A0ACC4B2T6_POPAL